MGILRLLIIVITVAMMGCASATVQKKEAAVSRPEFKKAVELTKMMPPPPPVIKREIFSEDPLADVHITIDAIRQSLSSVLYMIASEAGLNLVISPDINTTKPLTISVNMMPAKDALDIICDNAGVSYEVVGNSLRILSIVTKTYKFPYVRMNTTQSSSIGGDVFGASEANLKGDYNIKYENPPEMNDVQSQIIHGVKAILFPTAAATPQTADSSGEAVPAAAAPVAGEGSNGFFVGNEGYVYNRFTGVLKVSTSPQRMKMVDSYMKDVLSEINKQVLIEAKLVEVVLNDNSSYGINWNGVVNGATGMIGLGTTGGANFVPGGLNPVGMISSGTADDWFAFMASYGRVESVGNPRIRVMNGQSAMISSGQLIPYWEMERDEDSETNDVTITYTRVTVLDGIVMGVTAHIKEDGTITLNIVPVFSDVESVKSIYNDAGQVVASYPVINLKEAGTVLNVPSGETIVMGGLISNIETEMEEKVPMLGDIPVLGYLFKGRSKVIEKRELVIFLKTTILDGQS
jgi:MSHA biogenesis protein MshL